MSAEGAEMFVVGQRFLCLGLSMPQFFLVSQWGAWDTSVGPPAPFPLVTSGETSPSLPRV